MHHSTSSSRPHTAHHSVAKAYYRVRPGDTLEAIAGRTGVSLAQLRRLNPKLTPTTLFLGQKIRLR